jgi:DDE_Tnp_1-associated
MASVFNNKVLKASIDRHFGQIEDPRIPGTRVHYLVDIIVITLFAVISGADSWLGVEAYGQAKEEWPQAIFVFGKRNSFPRYIWEGICQIRPRKVGDRIPKLGKDHSWRTDS